MALQFVSARLRVGPDGMLISWAGRRRFIDARAIARIERFGRSGGRAFELRATSETGLVVHQHDGRKVSFALTLGGLGGMSSDDALALIRRIEHVILGHDARPAVAHLGARLARGARSPAEWLAELRAIGGHAVPTMRVADVDTDELRSLVAGALVEPHLRVAAAVALAARSDEDRAHVRVAAETIGDPKLRAAIETVVDGEPDDIAKALGEIDA